MDKAMHSEFGEPTEGKKIDEELFEAIENFDGDGEALLVDLLGLFRRHAKRENAAIAQMYANTHAKLRDLEKEFSDTKANLHRAYKGLENHKQLRSELQSIKAYHEERLEAWHLELQKQKELNAELVDCLKNVIQVVKPSDKTGWYNSQWIKIESLIKKYEPE